jgi:hypothetical protein
MKTNKDNKPTTPIKERSPFDWYSLTESADSILNGLVALGSRERRNELKKPNPDPNRIAELEAIRDEALAILRDNTIFFSLDRMEETIEKYSPILLAQKKKLDI